MRIVVDTNLWISAIGWPDGATAKELSGLIFRHTILYSSETLAELQEVANRPKFKRFFDQALFSVFLERFKDRAERIVITSKITACRDPSDNKFLALAVDGKADVIVTGDEDLLMLHPFRGVRILRLSAL